MSFAMLDKGVKLLRGTCFYFWRSSHEQQMKKSICGVYHFHTSKLYSEATVEEKNDFTFFCAPR